MQQTRPWLIIADDLTGAADCAIAFAKVGLDTVVAWGAETCGFDIAVLSLDTASRGLPAAQAAETQVAALAAHRRPGILIYKKIDSTMRGQPAAELAAQLAFLADCRGGKAPLAIIAPAFPGTRRTTEKGRILVDGRPLEETPLWARDHTYDSAFLPAMLAGVGLSAVVIPLEMVRQGEAAVRSALADAQRRGLAAAVCDAAGDADLAVIAAASLTMADEVMWVGSGGLAAHLARHVNQAEAEPPRSLPPGNGRPVLAVVGSLAESSRRQAEHLVAAGLVQPILVSAEDLFAGPPGARWQEVEADLVLHLSRGRDVLVEIAASSAPDLSRGLELAGHLARMIGPVMTSVGGLVVTGGDTACALLSHLGVQGIRLIDEVEAGVPFGITLGPLALPVISKAGAFGDSLTLARCLAHLKGGATEDGKGRSSGFNPNNGVFMSKPIIAITMGDPAGVGPEIIIKSLAHAEVYERCRPLVIGDAARLRRAGQIVGSTLSVNSVASPGEARYQLGTVEVVDVGTVPPDLPFGQVSPAAGDAAYRYIERAAQLALAGSVDAICTAPLNKEALHAAGHLFPGHTEMLAYLTNTDEVSMMLVAPRLRVIHVTTHIGLLDAVARIDAGLVSRTIGRAHATLTKAGIADPRIGVCAINPHAGEHGLFGHGEEEEKIVPAVEECRARGWRVEGPLPADALFFRATRGDFDVVVAMYHDQGHGPVKVMGIEAGVNITVGLPVVRTSVDHGTAFDIAGKGIADERSMIEALRQAVDLAPARSVSS
jgi:4-hydroxythreonine-4-phosphate dehydrogenase